MRHRGPDWSGVYASDKAILAHERLSIVDVNAGAQPLYNAEKPMRWPLTARSTTTALRAEYGDRYQFQTGSDCEVILALYQEKARSSSTTCRECSPSPCTTAKRRVLNWPRPYRHYPAVYGP